MEDKDNIIEEYKILLREVIKFQKENELDSKDNEVLLRELIKEEKQPKELF